MNWFFIYLIECVQSTRPPNVVPSNAARNACDDDDDAMADVAVDAADDDAAEDDVDEDDCCCGVLPVCVNLCFFRLPFKSDI